jgi:Flp pilus assembly pilin Flp
MRTFKALITARPWRLLRRDESGQDILEYGLLALIIGLAGILSFPAIVGKLSAGYANENAAIQADWQPCDPGGCTP